MPDASEAIAGRMPFVGYGTSHWSVLGLFMALCVILVMIGRQVRGMTRFNRGFAIVILALMIPLNFYLWLPSQWDVRISLPFDLCDLAWMAAAYALWTGRESLAYGATYYWGLTLTTQGLLTPDLAYDFPHIWFTMFFASHCLTPAAAVYLTWGVGWRPTWRLMWQTTAVTVFWGACMLAFNSWSGSNYLYVNAKPPSASLLDLLGPWPIYLVAELAVGVGMWIAMTGPWYWVARRQGATHPSCIVLAATSGVADERPASIV